MPRQRVPVKPELLRWARVRLGSSVEDLSGRFKKLADWERGEAQPTFKQLEAFARATHVPFGYFFLPEPPEEQLPVPDLRTIDNQRPRRPSPDLLDTLYTMQRRQAWLREELLECEAEPLEFVGSARITDDPESVGCEMRRMVGLGKRWAKTVHTWQDATGELQRSVEKLGIIAVINGIVGNNTHRKLNVREFRGFAISDKHAPLVFVNGADAKSAQMFTLAHELAHIWLGKSALTDVDPTSSPSEHIESWCDKAAAEFLVPERELKEYWSNISYDPSPFEKIAKHFKVSPIVAGRRAMDLDQVPRETFFKFYREYTQREQSLATATAGGDFYNNQNTRVGKRFATQVILAAKGGRLSFKEAYDLTGLHGGTFQEYAERLGLNLP